MRAGFRWWATFPRLAALVGLVGGLVLLTAGSAGADGRHQISLTGCHGVAVARNGSGDTVFEARGEPPADLTDADGNPTFTADNPFRVSANGSVDWEGDSTVILLDQTWTVETWGWTLDEGTAANANQEHQGVSGVYSTKGVAPLGSPGLYKVTVKTIGEDGSLCGGTGFVKVVGSPLLTPVWLISLLLLGGGAWLLYFGQPKRIWVEAPRAAPEDDTPFVVDEDDDWEYVYEDQIDPDDDSWEYEDEDE